MTDEQEQPLTIAQRREMKALTRQENAELAKQWIRNAIDDCESNRSGVTEEHLVEALTRAFNVCDEYFDKLKSANRDQTEKMYGISLKALDDIVFALVENGPTATYVLNGKSGFNETYENFLRNDEFRAIHAPVGFAVRALKEGLAIESGIRRSSLSHRRIPESTTNRGAQKS